jgi:hypothetical protein
MRRRPPLKPERRWDAGANMTKDQTIACSGYVVMIEF